MAIYMNMPITRMKYLSLNFISTPSHYSGADYDLMNVTPIVGDY